LINFSGIDITVDNQNLSALYNISINSIIYTGNLPCQTALPTLTFYNAIFADPILYRDSNPCGSDCSLISYDGSTYVFSIDHTGTYWLNENSTTVLDIWDDTDPEAGNQTRYRHQNIVFYANYTYGPGYPQSGQPINITGASCRFEINLTGNYTNATSMGFSGITGLYEYNRSISIPGNFTWSVTCGNSTLGLPTLNETDWIVIPNRPPMFPRTVNTSMPNETWNEDTALTGTKILIIHCYIYP